MRLSVKLQNMRKEYWKMQINVCSLLLTHHHYAKGLTAPWAVRLEQKLDRLVAMVSKVLLFSSWGSVLISP